MDKLNKVYFQSQQGLRLRLQTPLKNAPVKTLLKNANGFGKFESDSLERCNVGGLGVKDKPQHKQYWCMICI